MINIIKTDRLVLRTWRDTDLAPMAAINQDKQVMEYFPGLQDLATTRDFIQKAKQHYANYGYSAYAVELKANSQFIGFVGLAKVNFTAHFTPAIEIGYRLASAYWGQGYGTEAAKAVLDYGFAQLKLEEIVSFTAVINKRSRRIMEKIGLKHNPADDFDHPKIPLTSPLHRHVLYRLTRKAFLTKLNC
jgi:RimJ/RimL family protein N-acetyltransferase